MKTFEHSLIIVTDLLSVIPESTNSFCINDTSESILRLFFKSALHSLASTMNTISDVSGMSAFCSLTNSPSSTSVPLGKLHLYGTPKSYIFYGILEYFTYFTHTSGILNGVLSTLHAWM